ncbi:MAG: SPFH domain-containing protein, partial [Chitinophagaceae bacterium]|nr:SPFH domain-containing protein [Chitinophagaceae bacterium]
MEKIIKPVNGYLALVVSMVCLIVGVALFGWSVQQESPFLVAISLLLFVTSLIIIKGLIIIQPNNARVFNFFGKYVGTAKENGLFFVNPLFTSIKLTQRAQNLAMPTLKVNDKMGNPIEIAAVLVWQVNDTYKAAYEVADYMTYVKNQSESALRIMATSFAYDNIEDETADTTLRGGGDKVNELLEHELTQRLDKAGIIIK